MTTKIIYYLTPHNQEKMEISGCILAHFSIKEVVLYTPNLFLIILLSVTSEYLYLKGI